MTRGAGAQSPSASAQIVANLGALAGSQVELNTLTQKVSELRRLADQLKHDLLDRQQRSDYLRDILHELELQTPSGQASTSENPDRRKIRTLENRLDKIIIKYNEAQSIHKTYEQIVKRLKEERVSFDTQLEAIEQTLRAKEHDYEELLLMAKAAQQARDMAKVRLRELREEITVEENDAQAQLTQKRAVLTQREEQLRKYKARSPEVASRDEDARKSSGNYGVLAQERTAEAVQDRMQRAEDAFRRIKEATGDDDVNRVIQKFITQERDRRESEVNLKRAKENLAAAQEELRLAQIALAEANTAENIGNKRIEEETAANLTKALAEEEDERKRFSDAQRLVSDVKDGMKLLIQRLKIDHPSFTRTLDVDLLDSRAPELVHACHERAMYMQSQVASATVEPTDVKRELEQFAKSNIRISFDPQQDEDREGPVFATEEETPALGPKEDRVKDRDELRREALEKANIHTGGPASKKKRAGRGGKTVSAAGPAADAPAAPEEEDNEEA